MANLTYSRRVFDVEDEASARRVILTPEGGETTDERWERETPYLNDLVAAHLSPGRGQVVIDYGCGIGRMAKAMIERFGCRVLGVDISERMRALAPAYVQSQDFSVVSPHVLDGLVASGFRADAGITVWVLQHCLMPALDIDLLSRALAGNAGLLVVNMKGRAVPTAEGRWANDGLDVRALLGERFDEQVIGDLDGSHVSDDTRRISFWGHYRR